LKSAPVKQNPPTSLSRRKFAEHTGLEDEERIDNDRLYSISAEKIIRLL
jgi:hypothetical protein